MIRSRNDLDPGKRDRESLLARGPESANRDPHRWSAFDQAAAFFLLGLIYALVLTWLGFRLAAGGHGPGFFLLTCFPGLLLWPAAGASLAIAHRPHGRWLCPAIVLIQYVLCLDIVITSQHDEARYLASVWAPGGREVVLAFTALFLIGQAALWGMYIIKSREAAGPHSSGGRITVSGAMMAIVVLALLSAIVVIPARSVLIHRGE